MMTQIQMRVKLYHVLEVLLKKAAVNKQPMSIRGLYDVAAVKECCNNHWNVRDAIRDFAKQGLLKESPYVDASGDKRARIGYAWDIDFMEEQFKHKNYRNKTAAHSSPVTHVEVPAAEPESAPESAPAAPSATYAGTLQTLKFGEAADGDVEIVVNGKSIIVGVNPATGRTRIIIE